MSPPVGPTNTAGLLAESACGAAFAPGDAAGLAERLVRWQAEPATVARHGQAARAAYEADFTFEAALDRWHALLGRLAAGA